MPRMDAILTELRAPTTPMAQRTAKRAHKDGFPTRRGLFEDDHSGLVRLFDNRPYVYRDDEIRRLVAWLVAHGHQLGSAASFPTTGQHAGYTIGLVVRYRSDLTFDEAQEELRKAWNEVMRATVREAPRATAAQAPTAWALILEPVF